MEERRAGRLAKALATELVRRMDDDDGGRAWERCHQAIALFLIELVPDPEAAAVGYAGESEDPVLVLLREDRVYLTELAELPPEREARPSVRCQPLRIDPRRARVALTASHKPGSGAEPIASRHGEWSCELDGRSFSLRCDHYLGHELEEAERIARRLADAIGWELSEEEALEGAAA